MRIGIPRALIYWKRPYFWETFFENLGFEVLLSPPSNKEIVGVGVKASDPETCFSNKVFWGHLLWLDGKCDLIFVPRLKINKEGLEFCPKFFGMPDLSKILVETKILTETFDEKKESFEKTLERLGKKLNKENQEIKKAIKIAFSREKETEEKEEKIFSEKIESKKQKIVLISHPYNLYDDFVNVGIKNKLEKLGAEVIFIDEVPLSSRISTNMSTNFTNISDIRAQIRENSRYPEFHWEFGKEIMEKIQEILNYQISGAIEISSFQCGCDAVLKEFVEKEFKKNKIPFLYLIIDEHTGDAGVQTRLEAFIDTLK